MSKIMLTDDRSPSQGARAGSAPETASSKWSYRLLRVLNAPFTILVLSVFGVNLLLAGYQEREFRRNELFKGRLDRILDAQRDVIRIRADIETTFRAARWEEDLTVTRAKESPKEFDALSDQFKRSPTVMALRRSKSELEALRDGIGPEPSGAIAKATTAYTDRLGSYLRCVDAITTDGGCADSHDDLVSLVQRIAYAYRDRADEYLQEPVIGPKLSPP